MVRNIPKLNNRSRFSKILRQINKLFIRTGNKKEFEDCSRIYEIGIESLIILLFTHPIKALYVICLSIHWFRNYFGEQKKYHNKRYLIYTQHDQKIPFKPNQDVIYVYLYPLLYAIALEAAKKVNLKEMKRIVKCFKEMTSIAAESFDKYPSVSPRFLNHDRFMLNVVYNNDKPYNCCPSLHIAFALGLYNIGCRYFLKDPLFKTIEHATLHIFNSVMYTKQHSILDVAWGMLLADNVFKKNYDFKFPSFSKQFKILKKDNLNINYSELLKIYKEAKELSNRKSVSNAIGIYLKKHKYPKVKSEKNAYFSTRTKKISYF